MFLTILVPAYNEEGCILNTIQKTMDYFTACGFEFEVMVIDDGSTDATPQIVQDQQRIYKNLHLLLNEKNIGKGFSVRRGALEAKGDWILFLDADLSTDPREFEQFVPHLGGYDILIGSRAIRGARILIHQPWIRELVGRIANKIIRLYLDFSYRDTQCGFKIFNRRCRMIFEEQKLSGWLFDAELLYIAKRRGFRIKEIPITWKNDPTSTVKSVDFFKVLSDLRKIKKLHRDRRT